MKHKRHVTRRGFFTMVGGAVVGATLAPRGWAAASERVRLALIGCGGMGNRHLESLLTNPACEVVAVCDVNRPRYEEAAKKVAAAYGRAPDGYQDYRRVLDRSDIDAIYAATPDHWHALVCIHGCQAWKDVYVEKPVATTVVEGRKMVEAARRYGRVVQVGTQQRSLKLFQDAVAHVHSGKLGEITYAGSWVNVNGGTTAETPGPVPDGLDWDMWLGPAPWVPFSPQRYGGFRAFHDYANGELTNWGVHLLDVVNWGIKQDSPLSVQAVGGSYRQLQGSDDYESVDALYEYQGCTVGWEQRHSNQQAGKNYGIKFQGTQGRLIIDRSSYVVEPKELGVAEQFETGDPWIDVATHHNNFFDCIKSRQRPAADIEQAHLSTVLCHLAAIALDCRRKIAWDGKAERVINDEQANRHLFRPYRAPWHL
ncbi:MAG TPA: Gfo/Idh/MocA family oxidoreductase [Candidatus Bathyarchaeia archaeon]|nr:Gfo/Idh/MocA family oxidoreductase [Candidatus Bathyarchaeia archaeon]